MKTKVLIIGGGLSGLALAYAFHKEGQDFILVESRDRLGGRILSLSSDNDTKSFPRYDMGPSWLWEGQAHLHKLINELDLEIFPQHNDGLSLYQEQSGSVHREQNFAMHGYLRLVGGLTSLIEALTSRIPEAHILMRNQVTHIKHKGTHILSTVRSRNKSLTIEAEQVVFALPPRLLAETITFMPALTQRERENLQSVPTWMAGHAKFTAIYDTPFWRDDGLSGNAFSSTGPLMQIHDASPHDLSTGALFGFVGNIPHALRSDKNVLSTAATAQLVELFGDKAAKPQKTLFLDWQEEKYTASESDATTADGHPHYQHQNYLGAPWHEAISFCATETSSYNGGLMEGALEAADRTFRAITNTK